MKGTHDHARPNRRGPPHHLGQLYADDRDALFSLIASHSLDFGCRPTEQRDEFDQLYTPALLSARELQELQDEGVRVGVQTETLLDQTTAGATIGEGDRFEGGQRAPQGAGSWAEGSTSDPKNARIRGWDRSFRTSWSE